MNKNINLQYSDIQIGNYEKFLNELQTSKSLSYDNIINQNILNQYDFQDVCRINRKYQFFDYDDSVAKIEPEAEKMLKIGFKNYLINIEIDKNKPNRNAKKAIYISITAIIISLIKPTYDIYNDCNNGKTDSNIRINCSDTIIPNMTIKSTVEVIGDSLTSNTNSIKKSTN